MHVYLIGYRGSGKTTVGKLLANHLGIRAVDSDDLIESSAGMTIREIFQREGESGFRDREQAVIEQLASEGLKPPAGQPWGKVISLGGGAVLRERNRAAICASGLRVWLTASVPTLVSRMAHDETTQQRRPALSQMNVYDEVNTILAARRPLYLSVAQKIVDTEGLSVEAICQTIESWLAESDRRPLTPGPIEPA